MAYALAVSILSIGVLWFSSAEKISILKSISVMFLFFLSVSSGLIILGQYMTMSLVFNGSMPKNFPLGYCYHRF